MEGYTAAGGLAGLDHPVLHLNDVVGLQIPALYVRWSDEEVISAPADGCRAVGRAHQPLAAGTAHHLADFRADCALVRRVLHVHKVLEAVVDGLGMVLDLFFGQIAGCAKGVCV